MDAATPPPLTGPIQPQVTPEALQAALALLMRHGMLGHLGLGAAGLGASGMPALMQSLAGMYRPTGQIVDPVAQREQLYPNVQQAGPYVQWLGGSLQNPEPNATHLAIAGLLNNILTGWQDEKNRQQMQAQQQGGGDGSTAAGS